MTENKNVKDLKRDELGVFLRDRGIPYASRNKEDRLVLASIAEKRNVPLKSSVDDDLKTIIEERKKKMVLEDGLIKLPDPVKMLAGWEKTFINFSNTSATDVEDYIKLCAENHNVQTKGIKSTKEGESLYLSGHVTGVEYHRISPNISYCYIKAIVARQNAQTQAPYSVWIILHKRTGKVENAYCNCPAGLRGHCKHCVSLLHFIVRQIEAGCNKACTSKPQERFEKKGNKSRLAFDPRAVCYRKEKTLLDFDLKKLEDITNGNCGVLLYSPRSNIEKNAGHPDIENIQIEEEVETISKTIPVLANEIIEAKQNINQCDFGEELLLNLDNSITDETVDYVVRKTCKQSSSKIWFDHRIGRITASVANECSKKVNEKDEVSEKNNSVVAKIFNYKSAPAYVKSLKWGRERELPAIKEYEKNAKGKHKDFNVQSTGLHICKENPWLAATPDSLIICDCCGLGCLEIKNSEKYKNDTIQQMATSDQSYLNYSDNKQISLDKKHQYYTQVQIQMYATNTKYADFVVKTVAADDNIFIQRIAYDEIFTMNVIHKCKVFFTKVIVQELLTHKVKLYYEKLQNNEHKTDQVFTNSNLEINEVVQEVDTGSATTCMNEDNTDIHVPSSNPAVVCPICSCECKDEPLTLNEESICCSKCDFWFHYPCVWNKGNENVVRSKYRNWFCKSCKGKKMIF
ncbi:unnamed protein product [Mytilus edulis]|uniref:Uncharacterized protein n=1 Tax=Mytilus edulis TaxID=6550 RepID=A0A8S3T5L1_MYTED|nr:unnamed protein product [Mytilus edulis]